MRKIKWHEIWFILLILNKRRQIVDDEIHDDEVHDEVVEADDEDDEVDDEEDDEVEVQIILVKIYRRMQ